MKIMIRITLVCAFFGCNASVFAQNKLEEAIRFAKNPNPNALDSADIHLAVLKGHDNLQYWLTAHINIGRHFIYQKKDAHIGKTWLLKAIPPFRAPRNNDEWGQMYSLHLNTAYLHCYLLGDWTTGRAHYETCQRIAQDHLKKNDVALAEHVLQPLGNVYARFRDYEKAEKLLSDARDIFVQNKQEDKAANVLNSIGMNYFTRQIYAEALRYFDKGLVVKELTSETKVLLLLNKGLAHSRLGDQDPALTYSLEGEKLLNEKPDDFTTERWNGHWSDLHCNLAYIYQARKTYEKARFHFQKHIEFSIKRYGQYHRAVASAYISLSDLFLAMNAPDSMLHSSQMALRSLMPNTQLADDLANPPADSLFMDHNLYLSLQSKARALKILTERAAKDTALLGKLLETLDLMFLGDEILRSSYDFEESQSTRQQDLHAYFDLAIDAALRYDDLSGQNKWTERAWQYADRSREVQLADMLQEKDYLASSGKTPENSRNIPESVRKDLLELLKERQRIAEEIFEKSHQKTVSAQEINDLKSTHYAAHLAWRERLDSTLEPAQPIRQLPLVSLGKLQKVLDTDQAAIEYFVGGSTIFIFLIQANQPIKAIRQAKPAGLEMFVNALGRSLTNKDLAFLGYDLDTFAYASHALFQLLLKKPLVLLPAAINRLMFIPDVPISTVPLELLGESNGQYNFTNYPYLIRDYAVGYAGSAKVLLTQMKAKSSAEKQFVGYAPRYYDKDSVKHAFSRTRNALVRGKTYKDLPESRKEVMEIAALLKGDTLIAEQATEAVFKQNAPKYKMLHLSMHAWVEENDPKFSKLLFALPLPSDKEDGDLNAGEISIMDLFADLVALAACNTNVGPWRTGEGVFSLARAFATAGCAATLTANWAIRDDSTRPLMVDFYRYLGQEHSKDKALQLAKLDYLRTCKPDESSPYYWGGFALNGNMSKLELK